MKLKALVLSLMICVFITGACRKKIKVLAVSPQEQYIKDHPETSEAIKKIILSKNVKIGMTASEVIAAWGMPKKIRVLTSVSGSHKYWTFNGKSSKLYWKDGEVSKITK